MKLASPSASPQGKRPASSVQSARSPLLARPAALRLPLQRQSCACGGQCPRCQAAPTTAAPVSQSSAPVIAREPKPDAQTDKKDRDAVKAAIATFTNQAATISGPQGKVDAALFEQSITSWGATVVDMQKLIQEHLSGDTLLDRELQAAYISAIRALMPKAAAALNTTENALYGINSARMPMWAWQSAHRQETDISTPLDQGQAVDPLSGNASFSTGNGLSVTILADTVDPAIATPVTRLVIPVDIPFTTLIAPDKAKTETIDTFTPPASSATIQTAYPSGMPGSGASGYGRGTTAEDMAGGKVNPPSTTLRWHEGHHGLDFVAYLKANPLPSFNGTSGMTRKKFNDAIATYKAAIKAYVASAEKASSMLTHCVGTTIDTYNQANAKPGAKVKLECTP